MGALAWAMRQRSVSHPRSSNRTCRSPASGSPTGFTVRHTEKNAGHKRPMRGAAFSRLLYDTAFSEGPDLVGVCTLIATHLHLAFFESIPEVRVLPSAGITRLQRLYAPVRLPPEPSPLRDVEAATLAHDGSPAITRIIFPTCRAHYPGGSSGCSCRLLPRSHGLPQMAGRSAPPLSLSRPAQASQALRPAASHSPPTA